MSDSFEKFLSNLQPFSVDDVQLEPGDVGDVWIDPDFLKEHADLFDHSEDDLQNNG